MAKPKKRTVNETKNKSNTTTKASDYDEASCAQNSSNHTGEDGKKKQTKQERLEKKRLAERRRLERIRSDPESYSDFKAKQRESYHKRRAARKILLVSEMTAKDKKRIRERNRVNFRAFYYRQKLRKQHEVLLVESSPIKSEEEPQAAVLEQVPDPSIAMPCIKYEMTNSPIDESPAPHSPFIITEPLYSCNESPISSPVASLNQRSRDVTPNGSPRSSCSSISTDASDSVHKALKRYKCQKNKEIAALRLKLKEVLREKERFRKRYERLKKKMLQFKDKTKDEVEEVTEKSKPEKLLKTKSATKKDVCPSKKKFTKQATDKKQKK